MEVVIELTKLLEAETEHMEKDSEPSKAALHSGAQRGAALKWYLVITVLGELGSSVPVTQAAEERSRPGGPPSGWEEAQPCNYDANSQKVRTP